MAVDGAGKRLAVGTADGRVLLYSSDDGSAPREASRRHHGGVAGAAFRPGTQELLTAGSDGMLRVWNAEKMENLREVRAHAGFISALAVDRRGAVAATAGSEGVVRVWNLDGLTERATLIGHQREIGALAFHQTRPLLASQSWDGTLRLWNVAATGEPKVAALHVANDADALGLAFSPDGERLACLAQGAMVQLWDMSDRSDVTPEAWAAHRVSNARLLARVDGKVVLADEGANTHEFGPEGAAEREARGAEILRLCRGGPGMKRWLTVHRDGSLRWRGSAEPFAAVGVKLLAAAGQGAFLVTAGEDGTVHLSALAKETPKTMIAAKVPGAVGAAVSSDGRRVAAWDAKGRLRAGAPGALKQVPGAEAHGIRQAVWHPVREALVVRNMTRNLLLLDTKTGKVLQRMPGHSEMIKAMALDASSRWMVTGAEDGQVRIWDLKEQTRSVLLTSLGQWVEDVMMDPNARFVTCVLKNGAVRRLKLPEPDIDASLEALRRRVQTKLGIAVLKTGDRLTAFR
jgi:WD40 repeat protein